MTVSSAKASAAGRAWMRRVAFTVDFDYNVHPLNAPRYGKDVDWALTRRYLKEVRPGLVLIQSLGYFGWSCYPSRIAPTPPGFKSRYVETFRELCDDLGIRMGFLLESFQTVRDGARPWSKSERARWFVHRPEDAEPSMVFCPNSPFAEEYLIPYALECIERYRPAAFWFDHSRTLPCRCDYCKSRYRERYGEALRRPRNANERTRLEMFADASFVAATVRVGRALHERDPNLVVCWPNAIDTHTFRPVFEGADWISADEINSPDLRVAQYEGAYKSVLGAPAHVWVPDLERFKYPRQRPPELLRAEAATLLAHGLGMSMYHIPDPLGYSGLDDFASGRVASEFIRARAGFCLGNVPVPHVAIVASRAQNLRIAGRFQPFLSEAWRMHTLLSQNHVPCEVVNDDNLLTRLGEYDLVVLGEVRLLAPATARGLERFVRSGGRLLMIGPAPVVAEPDAVTPASARLFRLGSTTGDRIMRHLCDDGRVAHVGRLVRPRRRGDVLWRRNEMNGRAAEPLLMRIKIGAGTVHWLLAEAVTEYGGAPFDSLSNDLVPTKETADDVLARMNFGKTGVEKVGVVTGAPAADDLLSINYEDKPVRGADERATPHPHLRRLVGAAVREALGSHWLIRSETPVGVEFVVNRRGDDLYVHLVNHTCGGPADMSSICPGDGPVPLDVTFELRWGKKARSVKALPDHDPIAVKPMPWGYRVTFPRLQYHAAVRFAGAGQGI
ncbi:MAG: hypothetical protein PHR35_18640 [Kiritimatiellae bacterium]|nr:hypothetical protein [Kiritimatiellia bacterium]